MSVKNTVNSARVGMIRGKRFSPKEIEKYEMALKQNVDNTRVEAMFLYFLLKHNLTQPRKYKGGNHVGDCLLFFCPYVA